MKWFKQIKCKHQWMRFKFYPFLDILFTDVFGILYKKCEKCDYKKFVPPVEYKTLNKQP